MAKIIVLSWTDFGKNALYHFTLNFGNESQQQPERKKRYFFFQLPGGTNLLHIGCTIKVIKPKNNLVMYIYQGSLAICFESDGV